MNSFRRYRALLLFAAAGAAIAIQATRHEATDAPVDPGTLSPCSDGSGQCGVLEVPENRDDPESRTIELNIRVLPAIGQDGSPDPLFLLAGGPGQAATTLAPLVAPLLAEVREARDLVFVDPPYASNVAEGALRHAWSTGWMGPGSWIVIEGRTEVHEMDGVDIITLRKFGSTVVSIGQVRENP